MARICGKMRGEFSIFKQKGLELTTLAIIGGGIAGRSLIYALAKGKKTFSNIILFDSDDFAQTCALRSTAIVAARGVSAGHSDLGDLLMAAFDTFSQHVEEDRPPGIFPITQYTGALTKLDQFQKRYSDGEMVQSTPHFLLKTPTYLAYENAYMVDPEIYLNWLKDQAGEVDWKNEFVTNVQKVEKGFIISTQTSQSYPVDEVVFAGGNYNRYWKPIASAGVQKSQPVQGSYLEFLDCNLGDESFSLTLEGDNLVYHAHTQKLLIGSTTESSHVLIGTQKALHEIYFRLEERLELGLPALNSGKIIVGLREKAAKRRPYLEQNENGWWLGGYYKSGYSLGIHLGLELASKLTQISR
jgi:glycine/D-amino acid oxidase-like deaminating enzyme